MGKLLVHITSGPEAPTRAALGLLVAKAGIDEGHDVSVFLAGDAVQLIRDAVLDSLTGLGTGSFARVLRCDRRWRWTLLRIWHVQQGAWGDGGRPHGKTR